VVRLGIVDESCISAGVDDLRRCSRVAPPSLGHRSLGRRWMRTRAAAEWILMGGGGVDAGGVK